MPHCRSTSRPGHHLSAYSQPVSTVCLCDPGICGSPTYTTALNKTQTPVVEVLASSLPIAPFCSGEEEDEDDEGNLRNTNRSSGVIDICFSLLVFRRRRKRGESCEYMLHNTYNTNKMFDPLMLKSSSSN